MKRTTKIVIMEAGIYIPLSFTIQIYIYYLLERMGVNWCDHYIEWLVIICLSAFISFGIANILVRDYLHAQWVKKMEKEAEELKRKLQEGKGVITIYDVSEITDDDTHIEISANDNKFEVREKGKLYIATIFIPQDDKDEPDGTQITAKHPTS